MVFALYVRGSTLYSTILISSLHIKFDVVASTELKKSQLQSQN